MPRDLRHRLRRGRVAHQFVPPQTGVASAGGHELDVAAPFDDVSLVEDDDLVNLVQAPEAVGDEQGRVALGELEKVGGEGVGRRRVEVLGRLVEDENRELGEQGAGQRDALALTAREAGAARIRLRWPNPWAALPASRPGPPGPARRRGRRRSRRAFLSAGSRPGSCRRGAGSARPARRPGAPRRRATVPAARRRASPRRCRRAGSGRGRRPASTCPLRCARPAPPAAPE